MVLDRILVWTNQLKSLGTSEEVWRWTGSRGCSRILRLSPGYMIKCKMNRNRKKRQPQWPWRKPELTADPQRRFQRSQDPVYSAPTSGSSPLQCWSGPSLNCSAASTLYSCLPTPMPCWWGPQTTASPLPRRAQGGWGYAAQRASGEQSERRKGVPRHLNFWLKNLGSLTTPRCGYSIPSHCFLFCFVCFFTVFREAGRGKES